MKKIPIIFAIIVFSGATSLSMARGFISIVINCPGTSHDLENELRNFNNNYIAGIGNENGIDGSDSYPAQFKSQGILPANIPSNLQSYTSISTYYDNNDATNPVVTCTYASSNPNYPSFSVSHFGNMFGAYMLCNTANSITLNIPVG